MKSIDNVNTGERVMITGTSRGLGRALLTEYSLSGTRIVAVDKCDDTYLRSQHPNVRFEIIDITDRSAMKRLIETLAESNELPNTVIFSAAIHTTDYDTFIDYQTLADTINVDMMSVLSVISLVMPLMNGSGTFIFCSSGVVIFPNLDSLGYYMSKLAVTKAFDHLADRYSQTGFRFKSAILGPLHSDMLTESARPSGIVGLLRDLTTGDLDIAAKKIVKLHRCNSKRMYYTRRSAVILWLARIIQTVLPQKWKVYRIKTPVVSKF